MKVENARRDEKYNMWVLGASSVYTLATCSLDWYIHRGGMSHPEFRAQVPEIIREYLGNSLPGAIIVLPFLGFYFLCKNSDNELAQTVAPHILKFGLACAAVAQFDIERVTAMDVFNVQAVPDFTVGTSTSLAATIAGKIMIDIATSNPTVVEMGDTDRLFDQPSPFRRPLPTVLA